MTPRPRALLTPFRPFHPAALALPALLCLISPAAAAAGEITRLELLGSTALPTGLRFEGTEVGGLSGLVFDPGRGVFYAVSDDPAADPDGRGPARFYSLRIDLADGRLTDGDAAVVGVTEIRDQDGSPFPPSSLDLEGIALTPEGTLVISSEGQVERGVAPFVRELGLDGSPRRSLPVPAPYLPAPGGTAGVRHNLAFEPLTLAPDEATLITAAENALAQDGPAADVGVASPARLLTFDLASGRPAAEYLYRTEPVAAPPEEEGGFRTNGLVELLALDGENLLALERSYSAGPGFSIRLYRVSLAGATDISGRHPLGDAAGVLPAEKTLLLDLGDLGLPLDNLEGLAWGPELPDGRRTLVMVSDNNFNPLQRTLLLAFAVSGEPVAIPEIQGRGHRSPLAGSWVFGVPGAVTAVLPGRDGGFFLQSRDGDGDDATSEGLFVLTGTTPPVAPGDRVAVSGRVEETAGRPGELTVTRLVATPGGGVRVLERGGPLPAPAHLGPGGRRPPVVTFDDDGLAHFDPETDGIDFWESLEGMLVELTDPSVVGPTSRFGELVVVAGGTAAGPRTRRGGLRLSPGDANPERLTVGSLRAAEAPQADVGDLLRGPLRGVVHYAFAVYRLLLTGPWPERVPGGRSRPETTALRGDREHLTVATWNLWNLDPGDGAERFARVAERIVRHLGSPDVLGLQEMQDGSGPADDGVVDGGPTFERLIEAVAAAGGPRYVFRQIDPVDGGEGGEPGGNIRVGFLIDPERVEIIDRDPGGALDATAVEVVSSRLELTRSPGRVAPLDPAFAGDETRGQGGSRRSLALELRFGGETLFLIDNHLRSKGGDDRLSGARQPPVPWSEDQRSRQAQRVAELVEALLAVDPEARVVVLGDLNEHPYRPPVRRLVAAGLASLIERLPEEDRYTYNFAGNSQVLDHILVSPALADGAEIDIVHTEADSAHERRASDHDAVVARLRVGS